tara:strand:+ start:10521 stop:11141 length:621 start_codon:yes stop_codon:yes gene_type:complete
MKPYYHKDLLEVGVDEVARGCLAGRVYSAAVIWPKELEDDICHPVIKDSKKLSRRRRLILKDYIEEYAIDFAVGWVDEKTIDEVNIMNATMKAMHKALDNLNVDMDYLLIDGNYFKPYVKNKKVVPYKCVVGGDRTYTPIACASILAKVYHDQYIEKLCDTHPELHKQYGWRSNMCYGTEKHVDGIKVYGISPYHRKTFGICKEYC